MIDINTASGLSLVAVGLLIIVFAKQIDKHTEELSDEFPLFTHYPAYLNYFAGIVGVVLGIAWTIFG